MRVIVARKDLSDALIWLRDRDYLPVRNERETPLSRMNQLIETWRGNNADIPVELNLDSFRVSKEDAMLFKLTWSHI